MTKSFYQKSRVFFAGLIGTRRNHFIRSPAFFRGIVIEIKRSPLCASKPRSLRAGFFIQCLTVKKNDPHSQAVSRLSIRIIASTPPLYPVPWL
jgi:hypothetical protein